MGTGGPIQPGYEWANRTVDQERAGHPSTLRGPSEPEGTGGVVDPDIKRYINRTYPYKRDSLEQLQQEDQIAQTIVNESKKTLANLKGVDPNNISAAQRPFYDEFVRKWLPALLWRRHYYAGFGANNPEAIALMSEINGILTSPEVVQIQESKQIKSPNKSPILRSKPQNIA